MGYAECDFIMESRTGSVSSGLGSSTGRRGQTVKSSPFCPRSSSKLTQSIVRDHMVSHYKKVYSAKAAIDTSVPKSMIHSVKYNDHIRQDRFRKGGRPQSAHSLSQNNSRASCFLAQSRLSLQYEDNSYLCSRTSMASSSKFRTSFHAKDTVKQSRKVEHSHHSRPASQSESRSPESTLRRKQSVCSLSASGAQSFCKTFQDPVQKTYSGDLLQKHSQHFTHAKPFTPKTLKTDKSSYLEKYRYYRAPLRKPTQDCKDYTLMQQETSDRGMKTTECTQEYDQPSQGFVTEHEWPEDESNGTYLLASRQKRRLNKSRDYSFFDSSSRTSPEDKKSLNRKKASAEEEELKYLEFISAVTEDILSRRHISDRVLDRVIKHHIDMNRHRLDEGKMLHLLAVLRKDFEEPTNTTTSNTELEKRQSDLLDSLQPFLESGGEQVKTQEDDGVFSYASLIKQCHSPNFTDALLVSTPVCSPERTASPITTNEKDHESNNREKLLSSPRPGEHLPENTDVSEEDVHQNEIGNSYTTTDEEVSNENREHTSVTSDEMLNQDQAEVNGQELEDLGRHLSESLHVSSNNSVNVETTNERHTGSTMQFNKPPLSSKFTQSTIKDMLYHHRKVYSAKAVIDTSAPKSLIQSVKYNDQNKKDRFRESSRPQSAHDVSYSSRASSAQSCHRTSQRTVQKPSGIDLVQKHSELFTQDRPFTPKILKSDTSSIMEKYRCYRAPQRKPTQDCTNSKQETSDRSKKNTDGAQDVDESSQGITECSEEELNGTYLPASRPKSHAFCDSSSRASLEGAKSPIVMKVFAEEEFEYLNFIFAVTKDILSRKHMSDRVLDRMIKNHIDMNRLQLDEGKMRHLVERLRGFLKEPTNISTSNTPELTTDLLNSLLSCLESGGNQ